jgi:hypothetical protein
MQDVSKTTSTTAKAGNSLTTKRIVLILGALVIVCATIIIAIIILRSQEASIASGPLPLGNLVVDESNLEAIGKEIEEKVAKGMFETHMNTAWTFPDGSSASTDAIMGNAPSNRYPFWFEVALSDTGAIVYTSSLMPIGTQLQEIKLNTDLSKGVYNALLTIHMIDEDNAEIESNVGFNITLIIEN